MSAALTSTATSSVWRTPLFALATTWLLLGALHANTVSAMVNIWSSYETFAHAFLVPPISAWLVWRKREVLARLVPQPQPWLLLGMLAFAGMWLLSDLVVVNAGRQFAWVAMLVLTVPALLGLHVARAILFPLLFLFFAVPMGEFMLQPMMDWTADFTVAALQLSGIPVYREGRHFIIPSGSWSVIEACSGVRYLIASFMVGTLFAYLNYRSWKRRALFMVVSILVPIVANWVRAYGIVSLGHYSGNTLAVGVDHLIYGWVFFGVVIMIMFVIGARWSEPEVSQDSQLTTPPDGPMPGRAATHTTGVSRWGAVTVATLAVMALPHLVLAGLHRLEAGAAPPRLQLPDRLGARWAAVDSSLAYQPVFVNPAAELRRGYASPAGVVHIYLAYFRGQADDSKLVSSVNTLVRSDDRHWNVVASGNAQTTSGAQPVTWRSAQVLGNPTQDASRSKLTVWRSYWIDGRWVAGDIQAKLLGAYTRLRGGGDDGAVLVLWVDHEDPARAAALLQSFVNDNLPAVQAALAQTRETR